MSKVIKESDLESAAPKSIDISDLETPISKTGKPGGASGTWKTPPTIIDRISPYLPSGRTAAQIIGAVGGGIAGAPLGPAGMIVGGGAGASIGESVSQLAEHITGSPNAPKTSGEAALRHAGALAEGGFQGALPSVAEWHGGHPLLPLLDQYATKAFNRVAPSAIKTSAQTFATRALGTDPILQRYMEDGLSELKIAEGTMGPMNSIPKAQNALRLRAAGYSDAINNDIISKQADIVVPGSAKKLAEDQIAEIPSDVSPMQRRKMIRDINLSHPEDLSIGELNKLRSELAATQSPYYGKDLSGQLTMDAGTRAIDIARGNSAREQLYGALDTNGLGGGKEARYINGKIGSIINFQDALRAKSGTAVAQQETLQAKAAQKLRKIISPVSTLEGSNRTTEENLQMALKRWDKTPQPINPMLNDTVPIGTKWKTPPAGVADTTPRDPITGEILMDTGKNITPVTRKSAGGPVTMLKYNGTTYGQAPPKTIRGEQAELQPTVIRSEEGSGRPSTPIFGESQTSMADTLANQAKEVPEGSTLSFKSHLLDGTELYHYQTPDGQLITSGKELDLDQGGKVVKARNFSGFKEQPTPPPKRSSKNKL